MNLSRTELRIFVPLLSIVLFGTPALSVLDGGSSSYWGAFEIVAATFGVLGLIVFAFFALWPTGD